MENRARMSYKSKLSQTKFRCETTGKLKKKWLSRVLGNTACRDITLLIMIVQNLTDKGKLSAYIDFT